MQKTELVQQIHQSHWKIILALAGGGSRVIYDLLQEPGGSRTLIEAIVPYSQEAFDSFIGNKLEQYCTEEAARSLAMAAFDRARRLSPAEDFRRLAGIGVTASLATDRIKRGEHRIYLALQTSTCTLRVSLHLEKGKRTRIQEEDIVANLVLSLLSFLSTANDAILPPESGQGAPDEELRPLEVIVLDDFPVHYKGNETLSDKEKTKITLVRAGAPWTRLLFGDPGEMEPAPQCFLCSKGEIHEVFPSPSSQDERPDSAKIAPDSTFEPATQAIFPGAFNPVHHGHLRIVEIAREKTGLPVRIELSVRNVDKPVIDFLEIAKRLRLLREAAPDLEVYISNLPRFFEKAAFFGPVIFIVGADTLDRVVHKAYYNWDNAELDQAIIKIMNTKCQFLLFCRRRDDKVVNITSLPIPPKLRRLCEEIPVETFLDDISSTRERIEKAISPEDPFAC